MPTAASLRSIAWPSLVLSFEGAVILFAFGIGIYFALPHEPSLLVTMPILALLLLSCRFLPGQLTDIALVLALIVSGIVAAKAQTDMRNPNPLTFEQRLEVVGTVSHSDMARSMRRLTLDIASAKPQPSAGIPEKLRIRVGRNFLPADIGDTIKVTVVAGPLPGPVVPNGYDPARRAFFDGLAGSGYAISTGEVMPSASALPDRMSLSLRRWRQTIAERVLEAAPEKTAGLQVALLTGLRDHIPDEQTASLRASGLAHILAISGLHMGMVAFGIFSAASLVLALFGQWSRERDIRKPAAIIAIVGATGYLFLSGMSVATQRAYIMVCIAFLAILLDRRALSMRSVAVAALVTLLIRPEALVSVGFQMSFAAVTALVVCYRLWQDRRGAPPKDASLRDRFVRYYGSLGATSLIAGFATGGFALFHFGRIANYGLVGNLGAMAIFPLVMASGLISLLLMPIGLEGLPLLVMGKMISLMLLVSDWVAALPGAVGHVKASHPIALALYGLGFAIASFATKRALALGTVLTVSAMTIWVITPTPDVRITEDGRVSLIAAEQAWTSSLRADRYGRDRFAQSLGAPDTEWQSYRDEYADCDVLGCRMNVKGHVITVVEEASEIAQACQDSDVVVLAARDAGPVARRRCGALLYDAGMLAKNGGIHLYISERITAIPIETPERRNRPWGGG